MGSPGRLHAMAAPIEGGLEVRDSTLVVQYEIKCTNGVSCDGQYLKLLQKDAGKDLAKFDNDARYTIMFGPDKCGSTDKTHFILQHQNPVSKAWEEKHANDMPTAHTDKNTHLYTLVIRADNSFEVLVDLESKMKGSLFTDLTPPINPSKEIDDPTDSKPAAWVDETHIDDPAASKPADWDEDAPRMIDDASAVKPSAWEDDEAQQVPDPSAKTPLDWNEEEDGEWEAPLVANPKCKAAGCGKWERPQVVNPEYKGTWTANRIENPAYKGEWTARQIANPTFFVDAHPHNLFPMSAVGFELLSISGGVVFDNILITDDEEMAMAFGEATWKVRNDAEQAEVAAATAGATGVVARAKEFVSSFNERVMDSYAEHPTVVLGAAFAMVGLLFALIYMCATMGGEDPEVKAATRVAGLLAKKNDALVDDDEEEEEEDEEEDEEDEEDEEIKEVKASASKPKKRTNSRKD
mmetsp:Transcript_60069/g.137272  ORF Transcript_60069/g.137272 Transcript_60069/m.137272 type:complete len:465 (-) Transcript_60069:79-1473(-)